MNRYEKISQDLRRIAANSSRAIQDREKVAFVQYMRKVAMGEVPVDGDPDQYTPEAVVMREQALSLAQAQAELQRANEDAQELQEAQQQATFELQQAQQVQQEAQQTIEQLQQESQQAQQQAQQAQEAAVSAEQNAAEQATAKMQISNRLSQIRQALADLVSQDALTEEGVGFGEQAGPGVAQTQVQQQQQAEAEQQAAMQQQAAEGGQEGARGSEKEAVREAEEAERAQEHADVQTAQAEQAAQKIGSLAYGGSAMLNRFGQVQQSAFGRLKSGIQQAFRSSPVKQPSGPGGMTEAAIELTATHHPDLKNRTGNPYTGNLFPHKKTASIALVRRLRGR